MKFVALFMSWFICWVAQCMPLNAHVHPVRVRPGLRARTASARVDRTEAEPGKMNAYDVYTY